MGAYIRLQRSGMRRFVDGRTQGFRMTVEVLEAQNMTKDIFVFQRMPDGTSQFTNIASPGDIEDYREESQALETDDFFRIDSVDLVFRSIDQLEDAWEGMKVHVDELVRTLDDMKDLIVQEVVDFGLPSSSSSSISSSSSSSSSST